MKVSLRLCVVIAVLQGCDAADDSNKASRAPAVPVTKQASESDDAGSAEDAGPLSDADKPTLKTVLDLQDVKTKPAAYEWFDFRPNVKKLILSGAAETQHIAILWYTTQDGGVGLHYHANTESVFVIDGTQTDAKGVYPTGTVYFNPPGSGHQITESSGFFVLAYASPPDFANTSQIGEYESIRIDTTAADLQTAHSFAANGDGLSIYQVPLDAMGGMKAQLTELKSEAVYAFTGNYLLVLDGSCVIDGASLGAFRLVVAKTIKPQSYAMSAPKGSTCLTLGVSF